ncbi:phosphoglycerate mutase [Streptococcus thermophilus]|uniref:phosphoglycerate mutase n=1 Tax=Streptococcus thermophilus TaxID=1308 RepID=UPI0022FF321A|nr:phosphoglycerate mutase [Streptococcus thermophilus]
MWFIRFEPNFQGDKKTILYNKSSGELYEVSEIYFHFLESIRNKKICQDALKQRYNTENIDIEKIIKIKGNLPNLGVILND